MFEPHLHHAESVLCEDQLRYMAEIFPNEGLDLIIAAAGFQNTGAVPANMFLCLFTGYTASTVGTSVSVADSYAEPTGGAYARATISSASWGAIGNTTSGRITTASQISFVQATGSYSAAVNGFWVANQLSASGDKAILAANFDDTTAVTINTNDQIKVTPSVIFGG